MFVNAIGSLNKGKVKSNTTANQNQVSFSAQKFPSGHYSDWFVAVVKEKVKLPESAYKNWMDEQLMLFRKRLCIWPFYHWKDLTNDQVAIRRSDYKSLRFDLLKNEPEPPKIKAHFDGQNYKYSSESDYKERNSPPKNHGNSDDRSATEIIYGKAGEYSHMIYG